MLCPQPCLPLHCIIIIIVVALCRRRIFDAPQYIGARACVCVCVVLSLISVLLGANTKNIPDGQITRKQMSACRACWSICLDHFPGMLLVRSRFWCTYYSFMISHMMWWDSLSICSGVNSMAIFVFFCQKDCHVSNCIILTLTHINNNNVDIWAILNPVAVSLLAPPSLFWWIELFLLFEFP